jgi:hypothetical protein
MSEDLARPQMSADVRKKAATPPAKAHGAKSGAVREAAILALLTEKSLAEAAARCGVTDRTLRRWLTEDADFQAAYAAARRATFDAGIARVQALTAKGVETLEELLDAKKFPAVRLGAARTIVELGMHQRDAETIMAKLEAIEAAQQRGRK